jgi:hypothetical protein
MAPAARRRGRRAAHALGKGLDRPPFSRRVALEDDNDPQPFVLYPRLQLVLHMISQSRPSRGVRGYARISFSGVTYATIG